MKSIKTTYSKLYNAGDLFNVLLIEKLSKRKVKRSKTYCAEFSCIGAALSNIQYSNKFYKRLLQYIASALYRNRELTIWGSGFMNEDNFRPFYRKKLNICSLRGRLSKDKLEKITGKKYDVPLADPGLLIGLFINHLPKKKYKIGVIPHFIHKNENVFSELINEEILFIDIEKSPLKVVYEIAQCETIISSSLHGLVFADALNIPNVHVLGDKELASGNYKFNDYYSAFNIEDKPQRLRDHVPTKEEIINNYKISFKDVENKKKMLLETFPFY